MTINDIAIDIYEDSPFKFVMVEGGERAYRIDNLPSHGAGVGTSDFIKDIVGRSIDDWNVETIPATDITGQDPNHERYVYIGTLTALGKFTPSLYTATYSTLDPDTAAWFGIPLDDDGDIIHKDLDATEKVQEDFAGAIIVADVEFAIAARAHRQAINEAIEARDEALRATHAPLEVVAA